MKMKFGVVNLIQLESISTIGVSKEMEFWR